ncbi:tripartite tricarboxylate transporter TctB family protein [Mesorhizobium sp. LHD-90]|uniref:tripartite tricarboxylate transporter TctB family protein n=1 Tax=Mesorhizobium sp. LHD-90 TaxID=3071414 RepID=UPI0027E1295B|nr:tripartite tricarboxylate transporter TctB family protein [Mesorhizobium sp. LHD-90]MDQ6435563.1 tripartite tricarboxylate transporter TctB family protein [Mesorhizobium sp. LHD-90]
MSLGDKPTAERRPDRAALVIAVVLILAGLGMGFGTFTAGGVAMNTPVGPKTVPYIIAGALVILGLFTVVGAMRGDFPEREKQDFPPMLWVVGGLAVQLLTMKTVGFSIATGLLFAATAKAFGRGPLWLTIPVGIVFSFAVWVIFAKGLQLSLPAGPLEQLF